MENNRFSSNKKGLSGGEEKLIREVDYDLVAGSLPLSAPTPLDSDILKRVHRVLISIIPTTNPIETLYTANKSNFDSFKGSRKSVSHLGTGDYTSARTRVSDVDELSNVLNSTSNNCRYSICEKRTQNSTSAYANVSTTSFSENKGNKQKVTQISYKKSYEQCFILIQPQPAMKYRSIEAASDQQNKDPIKVDNTLIVVDKNNNKLKNKNSPRNISSLKKRLDHLEKKVLKQEMVIRCLDVNNDAMSADDEESKENVQSNVPETGRPGCSYIQQYNHVPETSAFHRSTKTPVPLEYSNSIENLHIQQTPQHSFDKTMQQNVSKKYQHSIAQSSEGTGTTKHYHRQQHSAPLTTDLNSSLEKGHNSEQYGRHFTTYDGITARGKRHSASVPVKRIEVSTMAAERIQRIRQKLNPVRDYRLMDTVHYLAQGEFAPRDDGIKLTPSREAVLSDIVWEDVCRTHWPNARLSRRNERSNIRGELQRQIDNLLRERVAHVERRRRRHYKIIKLNSHRHDNCKPVGKTGDIIVAANNNADDRELDTDICHHHHKHINSQCSKKHRTESMYLHKPHPHQNHLQLNENHDWHTSSQCECMAGPSCSNSKTPKNREASCYFHTYNNKTALSGSVSPGFLPADEALQKASRNQNIRCDGKSKAKTAGMMVMREMSRKNHQKEDPTLEQFILLPTLVARTPSNLMRQKKFNALYHRILKLNMQNQTDCAVGSDSTPQVHKDKNDIGLNSKLPHSDIED